MWRCFRGPSSDILLGCALPATGGTDEVSTLTRGRTVREPPSALSASRLPLLLGRRPLDCAFLLAGEGLKGL